MCVLQDIRLLAIFIDKTTIFQTMQNAAVDGVGASTVPKEENGAEEVRHPSRATVAGGACESPLVVSSGGVEHHSSGVGPTAEAAIGGEVGSQDSQQRQDGDAEGKHEGSEEPSGSTPSPKVQILRVYMDYDCFPVQV